MQHSIRLENGKTITFSDRFTGAPTITPPQRQSTPEPAVEPITTLRNETLPPDPQLWSRLQAMTLDAEGAVRPISVRLAEENKWTAAETAKAIEEYKRFLYLAVRAGHPVTPSRPVDLVWHEHLIHTRHYWGTLCKDVLQQDFHHDPGNGNTDDATRLNDQYRKTLESYRTAFGDDPPTDIWPRPVAAKPSQSTGARLAFASFAGIAAGAFLNSPILMIAAGVFLVIGLIAHATRNAKAGQQTTTGGCGAGCGGGAIGGTGCADGTSSSCADGGGSDGGSSCGGGGCGGGGD